MIVIDKCVADWHLHIRGELPGGLDGLLADDCVFYSPVVFTPQKGKEVTKLYLNAAGATFSGGSGGSKEKGVDSAADSGGFRYEKEVLCGDHAVLEFESRMDGKIINGVDIITCNDEGKIVEFKVMLRPLQAVNLMHQKMAAMLDQMKAE
jgi:hypothetical protein